MLLPNRGSAVAPAYRSTYPQHADEHPPFPITAERYAKMLPILRTQPTIMWGIDRGANPDGSTRDTDVHLTIAQKQAAWELQNRG